MNSICVFCGSNFGTNKKYAAAAIELGNELTARDITLVYGGASVGLMATIANTVLEKGGKVIGVMPQSLIEKEVGHTGLTEMCVVQSMAERKERMAELSDGFISMPGGFGTLEELFEMLTWSQLGVQMKAHGLLNVNGFYDSLITTLDTMVEQGFVTSVHREMLHVETVAHKLVEQMIQYTPINVSKWIDG